VVQSSTASCRHHWLLSEPKSGVIHGVCKHCRARKDYPARLEAAERFLDHQDLSATERPLLEHLERQVQEEQC
jgi:hypothetical protein